FAAKLRRGRYRYMAVTVSVCGLSRGWRRIARRLMACKKAWALASMMSVLTAWPRWTRPWCSTSTLRIAQQQEHGVPFVRIEEPEAVFGVRGDRKEEGIALAAVAYVGGNLAEPRLGSRQEAMEAIREPIILSICEDHDGRKSPIAFTGSQDHG